MDRILCDRETFARSFHLAAADMSTSNLRDHAKQILTAISLDIETGETAKERASPQILSRHQQIRPGVASERPRNRSSQTMEVVQRCAQRDAGTYAESKHNSDSGARR